MKAVEDLLREVRYALRSLRKAPSIAIAAVLTLALGIGANTAIFSVLEEVVLRPLPYEHPNRLVAVLLYNRTLKYPTYLSYPDFLDWRQQSRSFDQMAAFQPQAFDLSSPGRPEHIEGQEISSNFFQTLGVRPALGHDLLPETDRTGGVPAAVISYRLWQDRFGGNAAALGKAVTLDGVDYTVVGVLPRGFAFGKQEADIYTPIGRAEPLYRNDRTVHNVASIGRLRPDVSIGRARAEMNTVQEHIDELNPATERGQSTYIVPLKQFFAGETSGILQLLLGAVGLVLLIACANVANLLLARTASRTREFAVRRALGASRMQIVRQVIAESLLLSVGGGLVGLSIASGGAHRILAMLEESGPGSEHAGLNAMVLLFAMGISIAVGIVFGILPALKSSNINLHSGLKGGNRISTGSRAQGVLVVVQIALALVLLDAGSLLLRTVRNLAGVNPGFDAQHIISFQVGLSLSAAKTPASLRTALQELVSRIGEIPGIEATDLTALVPLGKGANEGPFWVGARQPASMAEIPRAIYYPIGPDYLRTMQIPLLRGRSLSRGDNTKSELVVLIDDSLARSYFGDQDPLGRNLTIPHWGADRNVAARVVGVVGHVEQYSLDGSSGEKPQIYYSIYQLPDDALPLFRSEVALVARTRMAMDAVMPAIRNAVYKAGSDQPVYNIHTMEELVSGSMARQRVPMFLLVGFGVIALLLASVGTYGVISYSTSRRVSEIGIRMAIGARKYDILTMVIRQGLGLGLTGVGIGLAAALILTRVLHSFSRLLYGVGASDPGVFAAVAFMLICSAFLASYIPGRRAAGLDPMTALRHE